jgi:type IV pilus assembly protein PilC
MASVSTATAEFYYQLGLLLRSGLPLPESLRQLASDLYSATLQQAIEEAGAETSGGGSLTEILARHPTTFDPFLVRLLKVGEETETLPGMLFTVAQLARFEQFLVATLRGALAYPLLTIHTAMLVVIGASLFIIPKFTEIINELATGLTLAGLTGFVLRVGNTIAEGGSFTILIYLMLLAVTLWLFTPTRGAHRAMVFLVNILPGTWKLSSTLDSARVSQMLGQFMSRDVPASDALNFAGRMANRTNLAKGLVRCADEIEQGVPFKQAIAACNELDPLIRLTVRHSPEENVSDELISLGELYEHRVMLSAKNAAAAWTAIVMIVAVVIVSTVIISMFLPLVTIIGNMSNA